MYISRGCPTEIASFFIFCAIPIPLDVPISVFADSFRLSQATPCQMDLGGHEKMQHNSLEGNIYNIFIHGIQVVYTANWVIIYATTYHLL